ncbi:LamG-like jellyroll fold domain-containing protein [Actinoplanes sp. NPDC051494]|uniref:LamG-like jellyroll fold domain-containing protein n=1 Tax=Actinoplanes sp. NPDC051494 TaxID=3363907 RepID=UPI0037962DC0
MPPGAVPETGDFPLSWMWSWAGTERAWSAAHSMVGAPVQRHGTAVLDAKPVGAAATAANGGRGRAPKPAPGTLDTYRPYQPETKPAVAGGPDPVFDARTSKKVAGRATATSDEYRNADGSVTRRVHSAATNYRAADGTWAPIDTTLVRRSDGRWQTRASTVRTSLAATAGSGKELASLDLPGGTSAGYTLDGAAPVAAEVKGRVATYPSVLPGVDLTLEPLDVGLKETLVLNKPGTASSWTFPLALDGLTPSAAATGEIQLRDKAGKVVAWIPRGYMEDSRVDPGTGLRTRSDAVTYTLIEVRGEPALRVDADRAWLADPARVYPVRVDPTLTTAASGDVFVDNDASTTNQNGDYLPVGTNNGTIKARSFIHLDGLTGSAATNKRVTTAKLKLYLSYAKCFQPLPFSVHRVNASWTVANLTNGSYPGPAISDPIGTLTVADATTACNNTISGSRSIGQWVTVTLDPATFNDWTSGGTNDGLALTADEADGSAYKLFDSANYSGGTYAPQLELTYTDDIAPQINARYPGNNAVAPTLTPELMVRGYDADSYPGKGLTYTYRVYDSAGTLLVTSPSTTSPSWSVPAGKLAWNGTYLWSVQPSDGVASGPVTPMWALSTAPPQNTIGGGFSQNGGKGFDPSIGNYTTSATDATVATVGPSVAMIRNYNSLDTRRQNAFGTGWSSVLDTRATQRGDTVVVTYPNAQELSFGRNSNGSFSPQSGRFATLKETKSGSTVTGYTLTDKDATVYAFNRDAGSGVYRLTTVTDANNRTLTVLYDTEGGNPYRLIGASGRSLWVSWSTPAGSTAPHVATVYTDPVTPGDWNTSVTWRYMYGADDRLTTVCSPVDWDKCWQYEYDTTGRYAAAVQNAGASSYWPLDETSGSVARSTALGGTGVDAARYYGVTLGQPGGLAGSSAKSAGLTGTNSYVQLPAALIAGSQYQSISMWFRTTQPGGVLFSYNQESMTQATTKRNYTPALYIGSDGKLRGEFWTGQANPVVSDTVVTDGAWHHAVLSGAGTTQTLYLDGTARGTLAGTIARFDANSADNVVVGGGFIGNNWPGHEDSGKSPAEANFFTGSVSDVAFFTRTLDAAAVTALRAAGAAGNPVLTKVTRPTGGVSAVVSYDKTTGKVASVTDENGGTWTMGAPQMVGSGEAYASNVLTDQPQDYWRLGETGVTDAIDQTGGSGARYHSVTLGGAGPFAGAGSASFNGTSSYLGLPPADAPHTGPATVEMWFKQDAASPGGVLYAYQSATMEDLASGADWTPALYIGTDGKLRGGFWSGAPTNVITTSGSVADGTWHHVALSATTTGQSLYLDGTLVGTRAGALQDAGSENVLIGAGKWAGGFPGASTATAGWFKGSIAEVAYHRNALTGTQIAARKTASGQTTPVAITLVDGVVTPVPQAVSRVVVTGPGGEKVTYNYDVVNGNRLVAQTDGRGYETKFAYDVGGFGNVTVNPRGIWTQNLQDVRGNTKQTITCQNQSTKVCSSVYYTYFPDATTTVLTPDARNDLLLDVRDGRSTSATDNNFRTSYGYDTYGNRISVTDPLGHETRTDYSAGTETAVGGGKVPAGLPTRIVTAGGSAQTVAYYSSGDIAQITDPLGKITKFGYDPLGRLLTETEISDTYPSGLVTTHTYDAGGREVTETEPGVTNKVTGVKHTSRTTTTYDVDDNVLQTREEDLTGGDPARTEKHTYNGYGQERTATSEGGGVTTYDYDKYGRIATESGPGGDVTRYAYDAEGNLLTTTLVGWTGDPNNPETARDLVITARSYDPAGRLASETDAMGWTTSYLYFDNDLPARTTRSDGTHDFVLEAITYDAAGNELSTTTDDWANRVEASYDAAGRVTSTDTDPAGLHRTTSLTYDNDDNVVASTSRDSWGTVLARNETLVNADGDPIAETAYTGTGLTPVDRWKLAETTGTTAADSAGNNRATLGSGVTWSTANNGSAAFAGTAGITATGPAVDTTRSFSVTAWAKLDNTGRNRTVVAQDGERTSGFNLQYHQGENRWTLNMPSADADSWDGRNVFSTAAPTLGAWTHLAAVFDAGSKQMKLYVNGTLNNTATLSGDVWAARGPLTIGTAKWAGASADPFVGGISDVQAYQQALTGTEVTAIKDRNAPAADATVVRTLTRYDQDGQVVAETDPNGDTTTYVNDEEGRPARVSEPAVKAETATGPTSTTSPVTLTGWNTFGEQTDSMDPLGNRSTTAYDPDGNVVSERLPQYTAPNSTTALTPEVVSEYDAAGRLIAVRDPVGNRTRYAYDQLDRLTSARDAEDNTTRYRYDLAGDLLSSTDPTGAVKLSTWDYLGRPVTTTDVVRQTGENYTTSYEYGYGGWESKRTSPSGVVTSTLYNAAGEVRAFTDGAGNTTTYAYDGLGQVTDTKLPDNTVSSTWYDLAGREVRSAQRDANGTELRSTSARYDKSGKPVATTDARGTTTRFTYDATGMLTAESQPISPSDAIETSFGYDLAGNATRFTDGRGNTFWTMYNTLGLPESQLEPSTSAHPNSADRTWTTSYDAAGRAINLTLPGGVSVNNSYTTLGQLEHQSGTGADAPTADRNFEYDANGRITGFSAPGGMNRISYDDRDLPTSITGPSGDTTYGYRSDGALTRRVDAGGTTTFDYDDAGRLSALVNPAGEISQRYTYNTMSQVSKITYGSTGTTRTFGYDNLHRLTADELRTPASASVAKIGYGWDANDNLTSKTTTGFAGAAANTYTYDLADRLTSWNNGTNTTVYAYDKSGNRVQNGARTFTYDQRNRLLTAAGVNYAYTPRGTLRSAGADQTTTDAYGQVITQQGTGTTQTYAYDAVGRALKTGFRYSGLGNDLAADATSNYVRGLDGELIGEASGTVNRYAWTDIHDDVVGQFRSDSTALPGSRTYDPLGKAVADNGMLGSLGYQSEWTESATGRVDMMARWYNTDTGQFDSRDTVANSPSPDSVNANRYQYGDANPLTVTDPTGHWGIPNPIKAVTKAVTSTYRATTSAVSSTYNYGSSLASRAYSYGGSLVSSSYKAVKTVAKKTVTVAHKAASKAKAAVKTTVSYAAKATKKVVKVAKKVTKVVKKKIKQGRKFVAEKAAKVKKAVKKTVAKAKQAGKKIKAAAARTVKKGVHAVKDAASKTKKFVVEHKDTILEVAAIGGAIAAGMACTAATGGALAVGCMAGAGALINLAKDSAQGDIGSLGDALGSLGTGAASGLIGGGSSLIAGKAASLIGSRVGTGIAGRLATEAVDNGTDEVLNQLATTHKVNLKSAAMGTIPVLGGIKGGGGNKAIKTAEGGGTSCVRPHSFAPDTAVLMADGSTRPIEDVNIGDEVQATDPVTGDTTAEPVTQLHRNTDHDFADVMVEQADGTTSTIQATQNHPFWAENTKRWVEAKDLKRGDTLRTKSGGLARVKAVKLSVGSREMRDLTVDDIHTYYVFANDTAVIVHNNNCGDALSAYADSLRPQAGRKSVQYASEYTNAQGKVYRSHNQDRDKADLPEGFVEAIGERSHYGCSEVGCLLSSYEDAVKSGASVAQAQNAVRGGSMRTVMVFNQTSSKAAQHGTPAAPCASKCNPMLKNLGIDF